MVPDGVFYPFHIENEKVVLFDLPGSPRGTKFLVKASLGLMKTLLIDGARFSLQFSGWCLMVPFTLFI